ncbi:MAG TPA: amidohydrolase family protein, partial [Trebonia sp.]
MASVPDIMDVMSSLLLRQVRMVPLDGPAAAGPVDVLIEDGSITKIGTKVGTKIGTKVGTKIGTKVGTEAAAVAGTVVRPPGVPAVDGDGRWLIPGLWDAHVHLGQWALASRRLDLSRTSSPEDVLALAAQAARHGRPVVGTGQRAGTWARPVTVTELDAACGGVPVILINSDFHHAWLNTAALDALGLTRRDVVVAEAEWFAAYPRVAGLEGPATPADYRRVLGRAAAQGVVGLVD